MEAVGIYKMTWTPEDKRKIFEAYAIQIDGANKYGEKPNIKANLRVIEVMFAERFTGTEITDTIYNHMLKSTEIIKPAHIEAILNPAKRKITQSEFIHAQQQHAKEGFPMFGSWGTMINEYHTQEDALKEEPLKLADSIKDLLPGKKFIK